MTLIINCFYYYIGGEAGIRTLGARKGTPDFESGPFDQLRHLSERCGAQGSENSAASPQVSNFLRLRRVSPIGIVRAKRQGTIRGVRRLTHLRGRSARSDAYRLKCGITASANRCVPSTRGASAMLTTNLSAP